MPHRRARSAIALCILVLLSALVGMGQAAKGREQTRLSLERIPVPTDRIRVSDGDTMVIDWKDGDRERVRVLGIDTPEIGHKDQSRLL